MAQELQNSQGHSTPSLRDDVGNLCVANTVGGEAIMLPSVSSFPVTSARTQEVLHYGQSATVEVARQAVETAASAFGTYKRTPVHERRMMLLRAAELFDSCKHDAIVRQMQETSCTEAWAQYNVFQTSAFLHEIAGAISTAVSGEIVPSFYGATHLVFKEPVGPVLIIPPWNVSLVLSARGIASALAAGCTVVLKASELCPWTHHFVMEIFHKAGFPMGAVNMIMADRASGAKITEAVISHGAIRKVEFIGSAAVGRSIATIAGKYLVPVLMELGDQSPAIILDDADLEHAAQLCATGAMLNHGQVCFSTERIIVQAAVKEQFIEHLVAAVRTLGLTETAVTKAAAEKAQATIQAAVRDGAEFIYGASDMRSSASVSPSLLTNVRQDSAISTSEAFGPTAFLTVVDTEDEAIEEANSRDGGLSAAVFTRSHERGLRVARELDFGMVQVNNMTLFAEPAGPVGAVKRSGWGSNNGRYGIDEYLFSKAVSLTPTGAEAPH